MTKPGRSSGAAIRTSKAIPTTSLAINPVPRAVRQERVAAAAVAEGMGVALEAEAVPEEAPALAAATVVGRRMEVPRMRGLP